MIQNLSTWVDAAYAGMGYGLCENWADELACLDAMIHITPRQMLAISYDRFALKTITSLMQTSYQSIPGKLFTDATLAYNFHCATTLGPLPDIPHKVCPCYEARDPL